MLLYHRVLRVNPRTHACPFLLVPQQVPPNFVATSEGAWTHSLVEHTVKYKKNSEGSWSGNDLLRLPRHRIRQQLRGTTMKNLHPLNERTLHEGGGSLPRQPEDLLPLYVSNIYILRSQFISPLRMHENRMPRGKYIYLPFIIAFSGQRSTDSLHII